MRHLLIGRAIAVAAAGLLLVGLPHTAAFSAVSAPPEGTLEADLETPYTRFVASFVGDPESPLTYDWSGTEVSCGSWQPGTSALHDPSSSTATWFHGTGPGTLANTTGMECAHDPATSDHIHEGTFEVVVKDAAGNSVTCTKSGSGAGAGTCVTRSVVSDARCPQPGAVRAQSLTVQNVICGTDGDDELVGTEGVDLIIAGAGNDIIRGGGGPDTIEAGDGDDVIYAADVPSPLDGSGVDDRIHAGAGSDQVYAGTGNDRLRGGRGRDVLKAGRGLDRCSGGPARDRLRSCER